MSFSILPHSNGFESSFKFIFFAAEVDPTNVKNSHMTLLKKSADSAGIGKKYSSVLKAMACVKCHMSHLINRAQTGLMQTGVS